MDESRMTLRRGMPVERFAEFAGLPSTADRTCPCGAPADRIGGRYTVIARVVRVWMCAECGGDNPLRELPVPESIQAGLDAEAKYHEDMGKRYRTNVDPERGVSVKVLAPTGHGDALPGPGRVATFRWEKSLRNPLTPEESAELFAQWKRDYPRARKHERVAAMNRFNAMVDWKGLGLTKGKTNGRPNQ